MSAAPSVSIEGAQEVLLPRDPGRRRARHDEDHLHVVPTALAIACGRLTALSADPGADLRVDATGLSVVPGFVDAHTHLPFAGWRAGEYGLKVRGVAYEEIARRGGGIRASAKALAQSSDDAVIGQAGQLAREMLSWGTTAFECKSGYGLSVEQELRSLRHAAQLDAAVEQSTVSTALLAHAVPDGFTADGWMDEVEAVMPRVVAETDTTALDIYVESVAFRNEHLERMGALARRHGLWLRCHVEQFARHGSVPVALAAGARSVDHLACLEAADVEALAASECAAVLLPGAEFMGAERVAPGRALADAGAYCVLATDANPGTSPIVSMPIVIGLAVRRYGWSPTEAMLAATLNAASLLGFADDRGSIEVGKRADLLLLDEPIEAIGYRFGHNPVVATLIDGRPVHVRPGEEWRFAS